MYTLPNNSNICINKIIILFVRTMNLIVDFIYEMWWYLRRQKITLKMLNRVSRVKEEKNTTIKDSYFIFLYKLFAGTEIKPSHVHSCPTIIFNCYKSTNDPNH